MRVLRASPRLGATPALLAVATVLFAADGVAAQTRVSASDAMTERLEVPVFPGQLVEATLTLPAFDEAPYPAVLLLAPREPDAPPGATADAVTAALLERGIAVVRLDVLPGVAEPRGDAEPLDQPADDAFAVLQFVREREDVDGDRVGIVGVGSAADHAARAALLDEATRALVLLGVAQADADTLGLPVGFPLLSLPLDVRAAPPGRAEATPVSDAAAFLARQLQ